MGVERCQFESAASSRAPCLEYRVSYGAIAPGGPRCSRRSEAAYLAMITTSGCRPIAVGGATLRLVLGFECAKGVVVK